VGTVLGRATYGERFFCYQRCSIGASVDGAYPVIGSGVVMYGGSGIIGACRVGDDSLLSVNALVMDIDVPSGSVVFGSRPNLVIKRTKRRVADSIFMEA
jgi:serine O-acetyltransferase